MGSAGSDVPEIDGGVTGHQHVKVCLRPCFGGYRAGILRDAVRHDATLTSSFSLIIAAV